MADRELTVSVLLGPDNVVRGLRYPVFRLRVVKGPDRRREKRFAGGRVVLGSAATADFQLSDPTVSALHCELLADTQGFKVRDLGSKNGVRVANRRVDGVWLAATDDVVLGNSTVRFEILDETQEEKLNLKSFGKLKGSSLAMRHLYEQLARAAANDVPVLLTGETGTGKELAADAIVSASPRASRPLVVVDCTRIPSSLAETEFFGHEAGAFTGAVGRRLGAFERAQGGTVFLDEIGELPLDLQPKLLRVLERREVQRVGGDAPIPVDVRVIAATHRELEREVNRGTFRPDLYYRLSVAQLRMPSLSERREDIPELVAHFLSEIPGATEVSPQVLKRLFEADYPGNVRELRGAVERAVFGIDSPTPPDPTARDTIDFTLPFRLHKERLITGFERRYLSELREACGGNVSEMARRSGLSRMHVHSMLRQLGM